MKHARVNQRTGCINTHGVSLRPVSTEPVHETTAQRDTIVEEREEDPAGNNLFIFARRRQRRNRGELEVEQFPAGGEQCQPTTYNVLADVLA